MRCVRARRLPALSGSLVYGATAARNSNVLLLLCLFWLLLLFLLLAGILEDIRIILAVRRPVHLSFFVAALSVCLSFVSRRWSIRSRCPQPLALRVLQVDLSQVNDARGMKSFFHMSLHDVDQACLAGVGACARGRTEATKAGQRYVFVHECAPQTMHLATCAQHSDVQVAPDGSIKGFGPMNPYEQCLLASSKLLRKHARFAVLFVVGGGGGGGLQRARVPPCCAVLYALVSLDELRSPHSSCTWPRTSE